MTLPEGVGSRPIVPRAHLQEPAPPPPGRALVPYAPPGALEPTGPPVSQPEPPPFESPLPDFPFNPRHMSPREMAAASMELYVAGALTWEEHALLAFQPELHKHFDRTVGALVGERARPNRRRDFVRVWEERLAFERRYNADDKELVERTRRILRMLRWLARRKQV
jgi:hypothetical protein